MFGRYNFHSRNPEETALIAAWFARELHGGEIVSLEGDLGAGKTLFTQAAARELGITSHVSSPTYVLQKIYPVDRPNLRRLIHYDLYRVAGYDELLDIGFEDTDDESVVFAEWGDKFSDQLPPQTIRVAITVPSDFESREILILFPDARLPQGMKELQALISSDGVER